jgi:hypothetical protein
MPDARANVMTQYTMLAGNSSESPLPFFPLPP